MLRRILPAAALVVGTATCGSRSELGVATEGPTGARGTTSASTSSSGGMGGATTTSSSATTTTTSSGPGFCRHCDTYINNGGDLPLCAGSQPIFDTLRQCACSATCLTQCGTTLCEGSVGTVACFACMEAGCASAYAACNADF